MTRTPRFVAQQLADPKGLFGRFMGLLLNRHNAKMNAFAVRLLELAPSDRVLEIGFGGGVTLPSLLKSARIVSGIDRSPDAVAWAKTKFAKAVGLGRAVFREDSVEALPFENSSFSKICTVNTVYFWNSLDAGVAEIIACSRLVVVRP